VRTVPGPGVIPRRGPGTKDHRGGGIGVMLTFYPGMGCNRLGGSPDMTPRWLAHISAPLAIDSRGGILLFIGGGTRRSQACSNGHRSVRSKSGLGGMVKFMRITSVSIVLSGLGREVSWTTNVDKSSRRFHRAEPLDVAGLPVDDGR